MLGVADAGITTPDVTIVKAHAGYMPEVRH
jgi:hypothetical protein